LVVGLVIGAGLVFASTYIYGVPSAKTTLEVSTQSVTLVSTATVTQTVTQTVTTTSTGAATGGSSLVQVSGTLTVPSGSGSATLVINVKNSANNPITLVTVSADIANSGNGLSGLSYGGASYSDGNPFTMYAGSLPIGQSQSGVATTSGTSTVIAGDTYTFTVIITFSGGSTQTQTLSATAQV
jgi:hypothetical protein